MGDFIFHHISGAMFGIGVVAFFLGHRWAKTATTAHEEASAYYEKAVVEAKQAAADRIATSVNEVDRKLAAEVRRQVAELEAENERRVHLASNVQEKP